MAEGNTTVPTSREDFNNLNNRFKFLNVGSSKTITVRLVDTTYIFLYGRFGYNSANLSMCIISHGYSSPNDAFCKNFGDEALTVSCENHVITITFPLTYAQVYMVASNPITIL